jgi:branched-chain amino acid transport system permease protein
VTDYALHLAVLVAIWSVLALSQGLLTGYLGLLSIHQASAWAIGAYAAALLERGLGLPLGVTLVPGALAAGLVVTGGTFLVARGRRDDQVVASLCFQIIVVGLLVNLSSLTGGTNGLANIGWGGPDAARLRALACLGCAIILLSITIAIYVYLGRSAVALNWRIIRDNRDYAESLGLDAAGARLKCAFLAACLAGAAGTIFVHYTTFIEPRSFGLPESVAILSMAVIGQAPSVRGVLAATLLIILVPEALRSLGTDPAIQGNVRQAMFGGLLILAIAVGRR